MINIYILECILLIILIALGTRITFGYLVGDLVKLGEYIKTKKIIKIESPPDADEDEFNNTTFGSFNIDEFNKRIADLKRELTTDEDGLYVDTEVDRDTGVEIVTESQEMEVDKRMGY